MSGRLPRKGDPTRDLHAWSVEPFEERQSAKRRAQSVKRKETTALPTTGLRTLERQQAGGSKQQEGKTVLSEKRCQPSAFSPRKGVERQ